MRDGPTAASADGVASASVNPADNRLGELRRPGTARVSKLPDAAACACNAGCDTAEAEVDDGATTAGALCAPFAGRLAPLVALGGATTAAAETAELAARLKLTMNSPSSTTTPAIQL